MTNRDLLDRDDGGDDGAQRSADLPGPGVPAGVR